MAKPMPQDVPLMLCELEKNAFDNKEWIFEPKLDGLRVLAYYRSPKSIELISRNAKSQNVQFPDVVEAMSKAVTKDAILDGEIVCLDENGYSSFRQLQQRFHVLDKQEIARRAKEHRAYFYVFDIVYFAGRDLRDKPLKERKRILQKALRWSDAIRSTRGTIGTGTKLLKEACKHGREGIVGKRLDSKYTGDRSGAWVKIKCSGRQEFVIGGFTDPQRTRVGLAALLVGYYEKGDAFRYAGKVGTGYTREVLLDLRKKLEGIEIRQSPFADGKAPRGPGVHWTHPKLVAEIAFAEWTQNGLLRQPRFEGLREDKSPKEVKREMAKNLH